MFETPNRRQRSYGGDNEPYFGNSTYGTQTNPDFYRPRTANNQSLHRRDVSADNIMARDQSFSSQSSPYINGKKNVSFQNPAMVSSQVFYEHNYGYKNDLPNDRLLVPVKNDRFQQAPRGSRTPNNRDWRESRESVSMTPSRPQRLDVSEDRFARSRPFEAQRPDQEAYTPKQSQSFIAPNNEREVERMTRPRENSEREVERMTRPRENRRASRDYSTTSEPPVQRNTEWHYRPGTTADDKEQAFGRNQSQFPIRGAAGKPSSNAGRESVRDDVSEASTVVSNLSSAGYVCPKCLNRHMAGQKHLNCNVDKLVARESERRLAVVNNRLLNDEEEKKKQARAERVQEAKLVQQRLEQAYIDKMNKRRWPDQEKVTTFDKIFDRQEDHTNLQKALGESFRVHLKDQMRYVESEREREKRSNLKPYNTSLAIGEGYNNRFLETQQAVKAKLKEQVEEKEYNKLREQEQEKRVAQGRIEQAVRQLEEERGMQKEKERRQRKELQDAYNSNLREKEAKRREQLEKKALEKAHLDHGYNEYKARQYEAEQKFKNQLAAFRQGLSAQTSYKKLYQDKKNQKEGTSFGPQRHTKKVYPCGDCNGLYEKVHLTKL